ncbi:MAG: sodium/proline symporter [bacterium]
MLTKLSVVGLYFLALIGIGFIASRRMKNVRDYFAAGKRLGFFTAALSAQSTGESAWLLLGLTGMGAAVGFKAFWVVIGEVIGVSITWLLMSRRFKRLTDQYDSITIPDYLEDRFREKSHSLRLIAAAALVVFVTIYVSAQIFATGKAFNSFLGWNFYYGAILGFAIVVTYSVVGGFLAVAWTDTFQGTLMVLGLVALPVAGLFSAGGWGEVTANLAAIDPALLTFSGAGGWNLAALISGIGLASVGLGFMGSPQIFVRFISLRSVQELRAGAVVGVVWTIIADSGAVLTGMIGRSLLTEPGNSVVTVLGENAESVLPMMAGMLMPLFIVGLYIAVVLSAIMSTADSLLVVASSAAVRDYYQKVRHPNLGDDTLVGMSRKATLSMALVSLTIAMLVAWNTHEGTAGTIYWFVIFGWSGIAATFCPTILLSLFWNRMTARGAMAAMMTGFVCIPIFKFWAPLLPMVGQSFNDLTELPPAFLLSLIAGFIFSKIDARGQKVVADFSVENS